MQHDCNMDGLLVLSVRVPTIFARVPPSVAGPSWRVWVQTWVQHLAARLPWHLHYSNASSDFSPMSITRRVASDSVGLSCCVAAHRLMASRVSSDIRTPITGRIPVRGRPRLFCFLDLAIFFVNNKLLCAQAGVAQKEAAAISIHR